MSSSWRGRLFFGTGWLLYAGPVGSTATHLHHAFQLVLCIGAPIRFRGDNEPNGVDCTAAVIPPDVSHGIEQGTNAALLLYVDPETLVGRRLRTSLTHVTDTISWRKAGDPMVGISRPEIPSSWSEAEKMVEVMLGALVEPAARPKHMHPAVLHALRSLPESLDSDDVRIDALASRVGISAGRLAHVFRAEVGIPLRPYVLWLRLQRAAAAIQRGTTLTEAAYEAGFADSAHLARSFRRMFGITPSELASWVEWIPPPGSAPK